MIFYGGFTENNFEDGKILELTLATGAIQRINKIINQGIYGR